MQFNRKKVSLTKWRFSYLVKSIAIKLLGLKRTTQILLNISWVSTRLSYESCTKLFGDDFMNNSLGIKSHFLFSNISEKDSVLDIGCGTGRWTEVVAERAKTVLGIDYDFENIEKAKRRNSKALFQFMDLTKGFGDLGKFDVGLLIHVLEHIENSISVLSELKGVCSKLIIEVPDRESNPLNWARLELGLDYYVDADHVTEYSTSELRKDLEKAGWLDLKFEHPGGSIIVVAK